MNQTEPTTTNLHTFQPFAPECMVCGGFIYDARHTEPTTTDSDIDLADISEHIQRHKYNKTYCGDPELWDEVLDIIERLRTAEQQLLDVTGEQEEWHRKLRESEQIQEVLRERNDRDAANYTREYGELREKLVAREEQLEMMLKAGLGMTIKIKRLEGELAECEHMRQLVNDV